MEHTAHSYFIAQTFGKIIPIPDDEMKLLQAIGRRVRGETK
jgi:Fe2+ or Zn2+ uptake regulation protein